MARKVSSTPEKTNPVINCDYYEYERVKELSSRRLYLYGSIWSVDNEEICNYYDCSTTTKIVENILNFNRIDRNKTTGARDPIKLYINSPGGEVSEGFALVDAIRLSKTPIYTINLGEWCSMAFLIGIAGTKRFSLPSATFMMHEPSGLTVGKFSDMADKVAFNQKYGERVIKNHVLKHSTMTEEKYNSISTKDYYMLPEEALEYGFIDEIVDDIDAIL